MKKQHAAYLSGFLQAIAWLGLSTLVLFLPERVSFLAATASAHRSLVGVLLLLLGVQTFYVVIGNKNGLIFSLTAALNLLASGLLFWGYARQDLYLPGLLALGNSLLLLLPNPPSPRITFPLLGGSSTLLSGLLHLLHGEYTAFSGTLLIGSTLFLWRSRKKHPPYLVLPLLWLIWLAANREIFSQNADLWFLPLLIGLSIAVNHHPLWGAMTWRSPRQSLPFQMAFALGWAASILFLASIVSPAFAQAADTHQVRLGLFVLAILVHTMLIYIILSINLFINRLGQNLDLPPEIFSLPSDDLHDNLPFWLRWLPLLETTLQDQHDLLLRQQTRLQNLRRQLQIQERSLIKLRQMQRLEDALRPTLDKPVAAQLVVNHLQRTLQCDLAVVHIYQPEQERIRTLAVASSEPQMLPPGYSQHIQEGVIGQAIRKKRPIYIPNTRLEPAFINPTKIEMLSEVIVPLIHQGYLNGVLVLSSQKVNAFSREDQDLVQRAAHLLLHAWERSDVEQRKRLLLRQRVMFSRLLNMNQILTEAARTARQALQARFVYVGLFDQWGNLSLTAHSGLALQLLRSLRDNPYLQEIIMQAANQSHILHIRDVRHTRFGRRLVLGSDKHRDVLVIPLRLQEQTIGVILAFGKENGITFSTADSEIAHLLSAQVSAAVENTWLYEEVRNNLGTINRLYKLSLALTTSTSIAHAAEAILKTAYEISEAQCGGIVLYDAETSILTRREISTPQHPPPSLDELKQKLDNLLVMDFAAVSRVFLPLRTAQQSYGMIWLDIATEIWEQARSTTALQMLRNQAALALERQLLLVHTQEQAQQLARTLSLLEEAYDQTLIALTNALDARDRETEGHSVRVSRLARLMGQRLGLPPQELKSLERGALLHDIGKIGISDTILHKPGPLTEEEWEIMRQHPDIGARIVAHIPFLQDTIEVIRFHQERWDGSGYPLGLKGTEIPLKARIFAVADTLDALTSHRPYRQKSPLKEAVAYIQAQAGKEFDPQIVRILLALYQEDRLKDFLE